MISLLDRSIGQMGPKKRRAWASWVCVLVEPCAPPPSPPRLPRSDTLSFPAVGTRPPRHPSTTDRIACFNTTRFTDWRPLCGFQSQLLCFQPPGSQQGLLIETDRSRSKLSRACCISLLPLAPMLSHQGGAALLVFSPSARIRRTHDALFHPPQSCRVESLWPQSQPRSKG